MRPTSKSNLEQFCYHVLVYLPHKAKYLTLTIYHWDFVKYI